MPIPFSISTIVTKPPDGIPVTVSDAIKVRKLLIQVNKYFQRLNFYYII